MLLFVLTKVKLQRKVFSNGTGAVSVMAVIKLCPLGLRCTDDFGVPQTSAAFEVLCVFKNNTNNCRSGLNIDKQKE